MRRVGRVAVAADLTGCERTDVRRVAFFGAAFALIAAEPLPICFAAEEDEEGGAAEGGAPKRKRAEGGDDEDDEEGAWLRRGGGGGGGHRRWLVGV